jgi:hypothetical protein
MRNIDTQLANSVRIANSVPCGWGATIARFWPASILSLHQPDASPDDFGAELPGLGVAATCPPIARL